MRGPRRKSAQGNGLGLVRVLALFAALGAGGVTYVSVQTLGKLVLQQHQGAAAAGAGEAVSGGGGWRETWKLASELGAGEDRICNNRVLPLVDPSAINRCKHASGFIYVSDRKSNDRCKAGNCIWLVSAPHRGGAAACIAGFHM